MSKYPPALPGDIYCPSIKEFTQSVALYRYGSSQGMMITNWCFSLLLAALLLNACAATATQNTACYGQQIMIHFAPNVDVALPAFNASLSHDAGVPLNYMRPLFENYYLYCAKLEGQATLLNEVQERLQGRPDIRAVEIDRINRPQGNE